MKGQQDYQADIKNNKIKQGFLIKRSRVLKQWKQRWMVLTKTHLYSFIQKQIYKKPTQKISLKQVSTIKSYYKNQYNRPQIIRVQSDDADFYLSAKNHQQKWAWMTAIQKMTDLQVCPQEQGSDTHNLIRETIRMSTALRKTVNYKIDMKSQKKQTEIPKDILKRLNLIIHNDVVKWNILPTLKQIQQDEVKIIEQINKQKHQINQQQILKLQKIIQRQKIIYVPQIKQIQVIKTVYSTKYDTFSTIDSFFQDIMQIKCQNLKPLIDFVVYLTFTEIQKYLDFVLSFTSRTTIKQTFSNAFLQVINQQSEQQNLNLYLRFIIILYENNYQYFYMNDLKLLYQVLIRQIQMHRSNFNQYLIITLFNNLADKKWFHQIKHRKQQLVSVMKDIQNWINDQQSKLLIKQLLEKI